MSDEDSQANDAADNANTVAESTRASAMAAEESAAKAEQHNNAAQERLYRATADQGNAAAALTAARAEHASASDIAKGAKEDAEEARESAESATKAKKELFEDHQKIQELLASQVSIKLAEEYRRRGEDRSGQWGHWLGMGAVAAVIAALHLCKGEDASDFWVTAPATIILGWLMLRIGWSQTTDRVVREGCAHTAGS